MPWAFDLGTTNTSVARWDPVEGKPRLLELSEICGRPTHGDPLEAPRRIPSATHVLPRHDFKTRLGSRPFFQKRFFLGKQAIIGRPALEMQEIRTSAAFAPGFKIHLEREPLRPLARVNRKVYTARDARGSRRPSRDARSDQKAQVESVGMTPIERLTTHGSLTQAPRLSPDGKKIVYSMSNGKGPASVRVMDVDGKNDKVILGKYTADGFGWTPDSKTVAFGAEKLWRDYYVWSDVYTFSFDDERVNRVTRGARARTPDFKPDGSTLLFVTNDVSNNDLAFSKIDQSLTWITNNKDWTQYSTPRWRPDGELVAVSAWLAGGYREILLLGGDGRLYQRITADRFLDRDPTWTPDGKYLLFSSDRTGIANIYAWEQASASFFQVTNVLHGAFQPSTDGKWIVFQGYGADGYDVYRTAYDPTKWKEVGWTFDPEVYDATCKPPKDWKPEAAVHEKTSDVFSRVTVDEKTSDVFSRHVAVQDEKTSDVFSRVGVFGDGSMNAQEPQPDPKEAAETAVRSGGRPKNRPDKNAGVDLSAYKVKERYNPFRTMAPRFWLPAQVWFTESGATFGAFTGGADPLFRHSWSAWANYNTKAAFVGGGGRYFYDRWKPTFYGGADVYVLDYGQSVYEYPDFFEPGSHLFNIHSTGEHYFERHISAQVGAYYLWRSKWFLSFRYLFDNRTAWTDLGSLTYDPFLPVRGNFAGPSLAVTLDRTEQYRWSISPQKGWRATVTLEAQEPEFAGQFGDPEPGQTPAFRKEIATADFRAYTKVPVIPFSVLGVRVVGGFAQGDAIRPSTFRLGGALGESVFSITTPNYYSLRGYPFFAFGGERLLLASAEYRFPIWRVNRGIGTGPFFLRQIHGGLFADTGNAWEETEDFSLEEFHTGVGGEVRLDTIWYYYFPLTIRLGYGFALNDDPAGYAPGDPYGLIITLGTSF